MASAAQSLNPPMRRTRAWVRPLAEMAVCLCVLVILFRTFLAGGYMIETGSMAPSLLGFHWQVTCPSCRYPFAVEGSRSGSKATCPNCGQSGISLEGLSRNDGDHLLVDRGAFEYRRPRRWEVVVFRNPKKPTQAYVKRLIALPGEAVQIVQGDIYVAGQIQTKGYATQRGLRILVHNHDYRPAADDPDWQPRWVTTPEKSDWTADRGAFRFTPGGEPGATNKEDMAWVRYRHWIRRGGWHRTSVVLEKWPTGLAAPQAGFGPLEYDAENGSMICRGALPRDERDRLLNSTSDAKFRQAVERLYEASHIAPITDVYGYNRGRDGGGNNEVRDLMFSANIKLSDGPGIFVMAITDGTEELECVFDVTARQIRLIDTRTGKAMRTGSFPAKLLKEGATVEVSLMDRQALVAIDGELAFDPWSYPTPTERGATPWQPVRFAARGVTTEVSALKLFRDVYYTAGDGRRGVESPWQLGPDEYYVLGDNSPVSKDSRSWSDEQVLSNDLYLGKPIFVHLPSRKARFRVGAWQTEIRIPEISRIRYIR